MEIESSYLVFDVSFFMYVALLCVLLVLSALASGAEVAFFSLTAKDINAARKQSVSNINTIAYLLETPKKLLATLLIGNNFVNIAIVLLCTYLSNYFAYPKATLYGYIIYYKIFIETIFITFLILLFGEIIPKIYANKAPLRFAQITAGPVRLLLTVFDPISRWLIYFSDLVVKRLNKKKANISVDDLSQALEISQIQSSLNEEKAMFKGIIQLGNTEASQVMTPRVDVFALKDNTPFEHLLKEITENGYSRVPIYKESIDHVLGILYTKDLIPYIYEKQFDYKKLLKKAFYVPENKKLDDLLNDFKTMKKHLAIVVDEYGGTCGIITLEDVMEQIVGDISDEFDEEEHVFSKLDDYTYVFEGKTPLNDFYKIINLKDETLFEQVKGESETLAGFLIELVQGFPKQRQKINFQDFIFIIESVDRKRIKRIKVICPTTDHES